MPLDGSQQPAGALPRGPRLAPARLSRSAAGVSGLSFLICLFPASAPFAVSSFPLHLFLSRAEHGPWCRVGASVEQAALPASLRPGGWGWAGSPGLSCPHTEVGRCFWCSGLSPGRHPVSHRQAGQRWLGTSPSRPDSSLLRTRAQLQLGQQRHRGARSAQEPGQNGRGRGRHRFPRAQ